jgi:hypothetical protein
LRRAADASPRVPLAIAAVLGVGAQALLVVEGLRSVSSAISGGIPTRIG